MKCTIRLGFLFIFCAITGCTSVKVETVTPTASPTFQFSPSRTETPSAIISPTLTPTSTPIPTDTSTPGPTLAAHEWNPENPLIAYGSFGGDGACGNIKPLPDFTLLSDGELFFDGYDRQSQTYGLWTVTLSNQETCRLLNSIDQAGFFDYDPSTYIRDPQNWDRPIVGAGTTLIYIQAWRSNEIRLYDLDDFIKNIDELKKGWGCGDCLDLELPTVLPALRKTYLLLSTYKPLTFTSYQSDFIGVWVFSYFNEHNSVPWPLKSIKLSNYVFKGEYISSKPNLILHGQEAATVRQLFSDN